MTTIGIATQGLFAAQSRFAANAEKIARYPAGAPDADLAGAIVDQVGAEAAFKANLLVVRAADDMAKRLLDLRV